jgi:hypothetical protein
MRPEVILLLALAACGRAEPGDHPGDVSADRSTITVLPAARVAADGVATYAVAVTVRDNRGVALEGHAVELVADGATDILQPGVTDEAGLAVGTVASVSAGDRLLVVVVDPGSSQVILADTPALRFGLLVLAYGFAEESAQIDDLSSGGNNGAVFGATWIIAGRHDGALEFDGVDDQIDIGYGSWFFRDRTHYQEITVEAWLRPREVDRVQTIYQLGGENNCAALGLTDTGQVWFVLRNNSRVDLVFEVRSPAPLVVDTWTHVAVVLSPTEATIVIDGVVVAQQSGGYTWSTGSDGHMVGRHSNDCSGLLGAPCDSDGLFFAGTIDDLRVWDFGRTDAEVLEDMDRPAP